MQNLYEDNDHEFIKVTIGLMSRFFFPAILGNSSVGMEKAHDEKIFWYWQDHLLNCRT